MKQADGVNAALLAEPIDAADALLEPQRIPRQLDIDDQPAAMMQVQSFTRGIGRDQHFETAAIERVDSARDDPSIGEAPLIAADARRAGKPASDARRGCRGTR